MPYSSSLFDKEIFNLLNVFRPRRLLDIGAGAGKYGKLARKAVPKAKLTAIEIEADYVRQYRLNAIYHAVWQMSAMDMLDARYYSRTFDVVMMGDVLEHLRKSDGVDLLSYLAYRARWIIIQFPVAFLQNAVNGYSSETHISVWGPSDFAGFDHSRVMASAQQRLLVIKGFLRHRLAVEDVNASLEQRRRLK